MFYQVRAHAVDLQEFQNDLDTQFDTYGETQPIPIHRMPCALAYAVTSVSPTIFLPWSAALSGTPPSDSAFLTSTFGYPIARPSTGDRGGRRRPALAARTSTGHRRSYPLTRNQVTADTRTSHDPGRPHSQVQPNGLGSPAASKSHTSRHRSTRSDTRAVNCQIVWHLLTTLFGTTGRASKHHRCAHGAK